MIVTMRIKQKQQLNPHPPTSERQRTPKETTAACTWLEENPQTEDRCSILGSTRFSTAHCMLELSVRCTVPTPPTSFFFFFFHKKLPQRSRTHMARKGQGMAKAILPTLVELLVEPPPHHRSELECPPVPFDAAEGVEPSPHWAPPCRRESSPPLPG